MEPIISPWWFYLIGIAGYVGEALRIVALLLGFTAVIIGLDFDEKSAKKICLVMAISATVMLFISAFIPDKQTAYTMLAASVITPDNIQSVQGNMVDFITNVAKSIQEVK